MYKTGLKYNQDWAHRQQSSYIEARILVGSDFRLLGADICLPIIGFNKWWRLAA